MNSKLAKKSLTNVAILESDPLRLAGFKAVLDSEADLRLTAISLSEIGTAPDIDVLLVTGHSGQSAFREVEAMKATRPDLRIIVTGSVINDEIILNTLACGAKGYVDEAAPVKELVKAIHVVADGLVWAPRRVLAAFIERSSKSPSLGSVGARTFTSREKEVLELLVEGRPNREIGLSLGIEERTVKAHVAKLMRKTGVQNRIMLTVHAITHSLISAT
jgi:DNA-binding NarL/FixJ family response regulator